MVGGKFFSPCCFSCAYESGATGPYRPLDEEQYGIHPLFLWDFEGRRRCRSNQHPVLKTKGSAPIKRDRGQGHDHCEIVIWNDRERIIWFPLTNTQNSWHLRR